MNLLVVRHAVAKDRERFARTGAGDDTRPLTRRGKRDFKKVARGIARLAGEVDLVATSPLVRAEETAALLVKALGIPRAIRRDELRPGGSAQALLGWLGRRPKRTTVAIVGHEPDLSRLVALLLTGRAADLVALEKGGACLLSLDGRPRAGAATLRWLLGAKVLRRLGR